MPVDAPSSVQVAVRIRPQLAREKIEACRICTFVTPGEPQICIGKDKSFTYDHVFDIPTCQNEIFDACVKKLVDGCFEGYNATVLAYGQTGSGKTYTMGTGFDVSKSVEELGVIPRAVDHLFNGINQRILDAKDQSLPAPEFVVSAQFMELYNEEIIDLFDTTRENRNRKIQIHEDENKNIYAVGVTTRVVKNANELMKCLQEGALNRTTASTQMNAQSSRSHAIFSIHVKQTRTVRVENSDAESLCSEDGKEITEEKALHNGEVSSGMNGPLEFETLSAKFHFTDLAGSERLKRTGATGDRAKEGISINCGLLALGNVISALGDPTKKSSHVPYRDSKLTRLLQDSLGGNSRTLMIACVSPSDSDFMETMNTLKYANRARNIKNKVTVNQDKASQQIQMYKQQIASLLLELTEYKTGKRDASNEGYSDLYQESNLLREENEHLRMRLKAMQETVDNLTTRISSMSAREACKNIEGSMESIIENYIKEIEELRSKVIESESMCCNLRRRSGSNSAAPMSPFASRVTPMPMAGTSVFESSALDEIPIVEMAKKDIEKLRERKDELEDQAILKRENKENIATTTSEEFPQNEQPEDGDEENSSSDESEVELNMSESEDDENDENYQDELATLTREIDIKQKLILELEAQQRRIKAMQHQYENKLEMMETKIKCTEEERDKVLENLKTKADAGNSAKVKADYQKKLETMKKELSKLKEAKKAHDRLQREQSRYQQQLKKFKTEMEQMKSVKVRLMKQMKEQQKKVKMQEATRLREITQLKRESKKKEGLLRSLESRYQAKDRMIHRKQEEVEMLRKQLKPISGKFGQKKRQMDINMNNYGKNMKEKKSTRKGSSEYSSKAAKSKWQNILGKINDVVIQRETISRMERQMDRLFKERERLQKSMKRYEKKFYRSKVNEKGDASEIQSEINNLKENIEFISEQVEEIQSDIMQVEETLEVDSFISSIFSSCTLSESKFFLEQMLTFGVNKSALALESQNRIKEMESALESEMETSKQAHEVMRYMIDDPQMTELIRESKQEDSDESDDSSSESTSANITPSNSFYLPSSSIDRMKKDPVMKARRRTATPQELLHGITSANLSPISDEPPAPFAAAASGNLNETFTVQPVINKNKRRETFVVEKPAEKKDEFAVPSSPPPSNKTVPDNVFSRLTMFALSSPRTNNFQSEFPSEIDLLRGRMNTHTGKSASTPRSSPLVCVQVAEGHHKSVLCVEATDHLLFSGSKDRTVKIWNLVTSQEIMSLDGHPNNVTAVRHCECTGLVFTASLCYIKVWDIRTKARCIKVLCSSGQTLSPSSFMGTMGRTNRMPDNESPVNDFLLSGRSKGLYSASGTVVRIWDLAKYSVVGKMSGHTGHVMTMGLPGISNYCETVVTGSKDHYVKVYDVASDATGNIPASVTLEPPHMDGVESIAISKKQKVLFSGSRDKSIKKWDLETKKSIKSEYQAHQNWVCSLDVVDHGSDEILVSGGRGGILKIWDVESFGLLGDIRAHSDSINCITSNKNLIFSASSDRSVRVWRLAD